MFARRALVEPASDRVEIEARRRRRDHDRMTLLKRRETLDQTRHRERRRNR